MNFFKSHANSSSSDHEHPIHHVLNNLQTHFTNFVRFPNPFSSKPDNSCPTPKSTYASSSSSSDHREEINPLSSSTVVDDDGSSCKKNLSLSLSKEEIKQRLHEVSVYRMSYSSDPQMLLSVSSEFERRKTVFYFFNESDGQDFVAGTKAREQDRELDLQLINVPLSEIFEAEAEEERCARLVPDMAQVKNALKEREKVGFHGQKFYGVPVFQLKATFDGTPNNLQQLFFRKEDLEKALVEEKQMNHTDETQREIIQVMALEDIIQEMKDCSKSKWNDAVFMPPGNGKL